MDKTAFEESKERPVAKWMNKISGEGGLFDSEYQQAGIDADETMKALWSNPFPRSLVYDGGNDDSGPDNDHTAKNNSVNLSWKTWWTIKLVSGKLTNMDWRELISLIPIKIISPIQDISYV